MDKSSSLGIRMSPQEIFKRYKRQSLGMPMHPLFIKKYQVISQCAIFLLLHILCVILGASLFLFAVLFSFLFVLFSEINGWTPSFLVLEKTHSVLIAWNTLVFTLVVPRVFQFFQYCVQLLFSTLIMLRACLVFFTFICLALCTLLKIIFESCFK